MRGVALWPEASWEGKGLGWGDRVISPAKPYKENGIDFRSLTSTFFIWFMHRSPLKPLIVSLLSELLPKHSCITSKRHGLPFLILPFSWQKKTVFLFPRFLSIKVHPTLPFHRHSGSRRVLTRRAALSDLSCHIGMICRESDPWCRKWQSLNCLECIALEAPRAEIHLYPVGRSNSAHYDTPAKLQLPHDVVTALFFLHFTSKAFFQIGDIFGPLIKPMHSWSKLPFFVFNNAWTYILSRL